LFIFQFLHDHKDIVELSYQSHEIEKLHNTDDKLYLKEIFVAWNLDHVAAEFKELTEGEKVDLQELNKGIFCSFFLVFLQTGCTQWTVGCATNRTKQFFACGRLSMKTNQYSWVHT
jgi:hypothetical protein